MRPRFNPSAVAAQLLAAHPDDDCGQSYALAKMFPALRRSPRWRAVADALWKIKFAARRADTGHDPAYL